MSFKDDREKAKQKYADLLKNYAFIVEKQQVVDTSVHPCKQPFKRAKQEFLGEHCNQFDDHEGKVSIAKKWLKNPQRMTIIRESFSPGEDVIVNTHEGAVYNPGAFRFQMDEKPPFHLQHAMIELFMNHVSRLCNGDKDDVQLLMDLLAFTIQHPMERSQIVVFLVSHQHGVGKGLLAKIVTAVLGEHLVSTPTMAEVVGKWSYWRENTKLAVVAEVGHGDKKYEVDSKFKEKATDQRQSSERKQGHTQFVDCYTNMILFSNEELSLAMNQEDRRIYPIQCLMSSTEHKRLEAGGYYKDWHDEFLKDSDMMRGLFFALLRWEIKNNLLGNAPMNKYKEDLINLGRSRGDVLLLELIEGLKGGREVFTYDEICNSSDGYSVTDKSTYNYFEDTKAVRKSWKYRVSLVKNIQIGSERRKTKLYCLKENLGKYKGYKPRMLRSLCDKWEK